MDQETILRQAAEMAKQAQGSGQGAMVYPQPVPMSVQLTSGQGPMGEKYVILILQTPVGQNIFHFDPEGAERLAEGLKNTARVAKTGLEIPSMA
jgi:hypothetical protein